MARLVSLASRATTTPEGTPLGVGVLGRAVSRAATTLEGTPLDDGAIARSVSRAATPPKRTPLDAGVLGRAVLQRFPALRSTWPLRQASAWRQRQSWRAHPRRMASWYRDTADMRTRLFVSNLELPEAPQLCQSVGVRVRLFDQEGIAEGARRFAIPRNASLVLELGDLLPARRRGAVESGQVTVDYEGAQLGSARAYLHWYNERSLTSSHEKFGLTIPAVGGYWSVPNVQDSDEYRVYLAVTNLDAHAYSSEITLKDSEGHALTTSVELPANGSRFLSLPRLFRDMRGFLDRKPGVLYFGNNQQPAMYYYFVQNERLGTWRVQHL